MAETAETAVADDPQTEPVPMFIPPSEVPPTPFQDPNTIEGEIDDGRNVHPDDAVADEKPPTPSGADKKVESLGYAVSNMQKALPDIVGKAVEEQMGKLQEQMKELLPTGKGEGGEQPARSDGSAAPVVETPDITLDLEGLDPEDFVDFSAMQEKVMPAVQKMVVAQLEAISKANGGATTQNAEDTKVMVEKLVADGISASHAQAAQHEAARQEWDDSYADNFPDLATAGVTAEQFRAEYQSNYTVPQGALTGDAALSYGESIRDLTYQKLLVSNATATKKAPAAKKPAKSPRTPVGTQVIDPAASTQSSAESKPTKPRMWSPD